MSSKFLGSGGTAEEIIRLLNAGTQTVNLASISDESLVPGLPVCASVGKRLIGRQLGAADLNFTLITNPITSDLNMNGFSLTNTLNINTIPVSSFLVNPLTADLNVNTHSLTNVVNINTIPVSSFLVNPLTADLNVNTHSLSNVVNINGFAVANFVSSTSIATPNNIATYTVITNQIQDSGVAINSILTNPLTADLNLNGHNITNVLAISTFNSNVNIGAGTSVGGGAIDNVIIGQSAQCISDKGVAVGANSIARLNGISVGEEATGGNSATIIGFRSDCGIHTDTIIVGHDNFANGGNSCDIFGINQTNSTPNSLLIGNGSYVNIRASNTGCNLGTTGIPFTNVYATSVVGSVQIVTVNNIVSSTSVATPNNIATYTVISNQIQDSGVLITSLVAGPASAVSGNIASYNGTTGKIIQDGAVLASNVVSTASTGVSGRVVTFSSGKVVQDSGTLLSSLPLSTAVMLLNGTQAMTASIDLGNFRTNNFFQAQTGTLAGNVIIGSGSTITTPPGGTNIRNVYLGYNNDGTGFGLVLIGDECHQTVGAGDCNLIGATLNVAGSNSSAYGDTITITGSNSVVIGRSCTITGNNAYILGDSITNNTSNSVMLGSSNPVNIRVNNNQTCNLGVLTTNEFKTVFALNYDTSGALTVGGTSATSVALGNAGISTTTLGTAIVTVSSGAWYSVTTYSFGFTLNTPRLIPPTTTTSAVLSQFTQAAGVLTYTGTRSRTFRITYNVSVTAGTVNNYNIIFFNSIQGSTTITSSQAQPQTRISTPTSTVALNLEFSDEITLTNGQTVQLGCETSSTLTAAQGPQFTFVNCNIQGLLN